MAKRTPRTPNPKRGDTDTENTGNTAVAEAEPSSSSSSAPQSTEPSEEDIRRRAYARYLQRGGGHGMDFEDWLEAERELKKR